MPDLLSGAWHQTRKSSRATRREVQSTGLQWFESGPDPELNTIRKRRFRFRIEILQCTGQLGYSVKLAAANLGIKCINVKASDVPIVFIIVLDD